MIIVQISDLHVTTDGFNACGVTPTFTNLARCIQHINDLNPPADVVLVTGDITNEGLLEETKRAKSILDSLNAPYFITPGNHDDRKHLDMIFGSPHLLVENGFINYVIDDYELRMICMDSVIAGESGGKICKIRTEWLDKEISKDLEKPTIVFMHHPPIKYGILETDQDGFVGENNLGSVIEKYSNIKALLCGHIHLQTHTYWRGTVVSTAPSMGMQLLLDLTLKLPSQFYNEPPAYQLHYFTADKQLVSFAISTKDLDGPYPF